MPIYEYECKKCSHTFEYLIRSSEDKPACPKCKSKSLNKMFSVFGAQTKGSDGSTSSVGGSTCSSCAGGTCSTCH